ncbi:calcium ion binding protein [Aureococcus anophagefferens]|nr:calcium ion binding protein [Aureococcus anophagefferens]
MAVIEASTVRVSSKARVVLKGKRSHDLVLAENSLVAGATYAFQLTARWTTPGQRQVDRERRRGEPADVRQRRRAAAGVALETAFALSTERWVAEDLPLTYSFKAYPSDAGGVRISSTVVTLRAFTLSPKLAGVKLSAGAPNVTVVAVARDQLGGEAAAYVSVVAAAAPSAGGGNDTGLASTLIGAVSSVVDGLDADADLAAPPLARPRSLPGTLTSAVLPAVLGPGDAYDVSLSALTNDPYAGTGGAVTSSVARFGVATGGGRRRRRLGDAARAPLNVTLNVEAGANVAAEDEVNGTTSANLTCPCGFYGNATFVCPDGEVLSLPCTGGAEETILVECPGEELACATYDGRPSTSSTAS